MCTVHLFCIKNSRILLTQPSSTHMPVLVKTASQDNMTRTHTHCTVGEPCMTPSTLQQRNTDPACDADSVLAISIIRRIACTPSIDAQQAIGHCFFNCSYSLMQSENIGGRTIRYASCICVRTSWWSCKIHCFIQQNTPLALGVTRNSQKQG